VKSEDMVKVAMMQALRSLAAPALRGARGVASKGLGGKASVGLRYSLGSTAKDWGRAMGVAGDSLAPFMGKGKAGEWTRGLASRAGRMENWGSRQLGLADKMWQAPQRSWYNPMKSVSYLGRHWATPASMFVTPYYMGAKYLPFSVSSKGNLALTAGLSLGAPMLNGMTPKPFATTSQIRRLT